MNQAGLKLMPYALGLANPLAFTYGMIGGEVFDDGTRAASNGKYQDWGSMVSDKTGMNQIVSQMTNPGYLIAIKKQAGPKYYKFNWKNLNKI